MRVGRAVTAYSVGHFCIDFACAFAMFRFVRGTDAWASAALLYNFFAFAGQMPLGILADRFGNGKYFAAAGCLFAASSYLMGAAPLLLSVAAGLGNALYHIGGGRDILAVGEEKAGLLGVFVSPGAFGLFLGTVLGKGAVSAAFVPAALLLLAAAILLLCGPVPAEAPGVDLKKGGALALIGLFLVVCLRSYAGFLFSFSWKAGVWAWVFVLCVVLGKTAGGFLYDRFGAAKTSLFSLVSAAALFFLSGNAVCGCLAALLFNMTMPVTLRTAADLLPQAKGFSFGLLTFALFLGFLPEFFSLPCVRTGWMYAALSLLSLSILLPASRRRPS